MKGNPINKRFQQGILSVLLPAFAFTGGPVQANPQNGVVVRGNAVISAASANQLKIHQKSQMAVINWESFSIGAGETTRFYQPAKGTALNRVTGGDISKIYGQLKGNANVYVVNPNGIVVGASGVIDVGGRVVLSTLDIDDDDFMAGGADRFFAKEGNTNTGVSNFGTISSAGGDVVLMGGFVDNQGQIGALNGTVAIGSGGDILLQGGTGGATISVRGESDYAGTGINNSGTIRGAAAELKAHGNVYALAINNGGAIRANGADRSTGRVLLRASGSSSNIKLGAQSTIAATAGPDGGSVEIDAGSGAVNVYGRVEAKGTRAGGSVSVVGNQVVQTADSVVDATGGQTGGTIAMDASGSIAVNGTVRAESANGTGGDITITGQNVLLDDSAHVSTSGHSSGGRIRVGGDFQGRDTGIREADSTRVEAGSLLRADSIAGLAGTVIVWANHDTLFLGDVSASALGEVGDGGLIEISGKEDLFFDGEVHVGSVNGRVGTVLFDPGNVVIGAVGAPGPVGSPASAPNISIKAINDTLQAGANVLVVTHDGNIQIQDQGGGGDLNSSSFDLRDTSIQWTNSQSSFGAFAGRSIFVETHIRTSGAGSINLLAGWTGSENDAYLAFDPQTAWEHYVSNGQFGQNGGSVLVGYANMARHVVVGSRFGDTNVAGANVVVRGADSESIARWAQIGFHDGGQVFAPRLNRGNGVVLDLTDSSGNWYLSDGENNNGMDAAGIGDPIVAVAGNEFGQEVDIDGDGIPDGVRGINSTGVLEDTFIPYSTHYNSVGSGNWWWQRIDAANPDPMGLGGLRPEYGAGVGEHSAAARALGAPLKGATINVLATGSITLQGGAGRENTGANIGHGGPNRNSWGGPGMTIREVGNETVGNANFSRSGVEQNQIERRWAFNGTSADRTGTSIARLAPVYGNINVLAGVRAEAGVTIDRGAGTVEAEMGGSGSVILRGHQTFKTSNATSNSAVYIGHAGIGQVGEYYGDIHVQAGGNVVLESGESTRSAAVIGHHSTAYGYWNTTGVVDQQLRFFASTADMDNPNLRRGELFSGRVTTGFDPEIDPGKHQRYTMADWEIVQDPDTGKYEVVVLPGNTGNFVPIIDEDTGEILKVNPYTGVEAATGVYRNINVADGITDGRAVINFNPYLYSRGISGPATAGTFHSQGMNSLAPLYLAPVSTAPGGGIIVEGLDGSIVNGYHGNIRVNAGGDLILKAFNTEGVTSIQARDNRFVQIGHGGRNSAQGSEGAGYQRLLGIPQLTATSETHPNALEYVTYRVTTGGELESGSRSHIGAVGNEFNRSRTFMSITGDIDVATAGNLSMTAGNDIDDFVRIGHGGREVADYETSSFILGDIRVRVGGDLLARGGGAVQPINRGSNSDSGQRNYRLQAPAQIGHGGYRHGFQALLGDIDVEAGGNIHLQNGAFTRSEAKIGHDTVEGRSQVGGQMIRNEHFIRDRVENTIFTTLVADQARVEYGAASVYPDADPTRSLVGVRDFTANQAGTLVGSDRHTADIRVVAGGEIRLDHLPIGERQPVERLIILMGENYLSDPNYINYRDLNLENQGIMTYQSYTQIGHGGITTIPIQYNNRNNNHADKVGNIYVEARGGDVILENGTGEQRFTRIGHGVGASNRVDDGTDNGYSRAIELAGNIEVRASGDIVINARAADENDRPENSNSVYGKPKPSRWNPVVIGHGGIIDNLDVVVLGRGEDVNGIVASSNVTAVAGRDLILLGGMGVEASFAQLGHGYASDIGDDRSARMGQLWYGFAGHISALAGRDMLVEGSPNAWTELPSGATNKEGQSVVGAFAAIGHGGYQLDAPSWGDINVYAGRNLSVIAQQRTDEFTDLIGTSPYSVLNPTPGLDSVASLFNFAKIGHFAVEDGARDFNTRNDEVSVRNQEGDIVVVVGQDLLVAGGTTPDVDRQTIYGAFAQIGHGGPSINGDLAGDITVLVKRNINVSGGTEIGDAGTVLTTVPALNNYAMIGHGDRLYDTSGHIDAIFNDAGGYRDGDIVVAAGGHGIFHRSLVGHVDPQVGTPDQTYSGNTLVAVSRTNPFFGGGGTLRATGGSVFSSGGGGVGSQLQFFVPSRSANRMDATTRLNEQTATFATAPDDFAAPFNPANGQLAGRADEVYLTPDLWWDQTNRAYELGHASAGVFPTDPFSGQGGAIALVQEPGGVYNLDSLVAGALGSSAGIYRDGNGVSGQGHYTLYYDAIEHVPNIPPAPPGPPSMPEIPVPGSIYDPDFDFSGLFFTDTYDAFFREEAPGDWLYPLLGLFERDELTQEESGAWRIENALDNLFGSRRDSTMEEEEDEDRRRRRARGQSSGQVGMTYYVYEPGTNRYSSYRVFGNQLTTFYPAN